MATTTTHYGFDIPQSTDLVKDGATAIATLGQDIDTAMNTALGTNKAGMVLLNTTSFSGVSSQSVADNTFSSTYDNYRILITATSSTGAALRFRFRAAGVDLSGSVYNQEDAGADGATVSAQRATAQTSGYLGYMDTAKSNFAYDFFQPNVAVPKYYSGLFTRNTGNIIIAMLGGYVNQSTSYDALTLIPSSGTITGSISIYGYNK